MPHVLFVCTANICRSPVAQVLFADWLTRHPQPEAWDVSSAGIWAQAGLPATAFSVQVAGEYGLDLTPHRSRRVDRRLLQSVDLVLCMSQMHGTSLREAFPAYADRTHLLSAIAGESSDIDDPYGGPLQAYAVMARRLRQLIENGGAQIVELARRAG